MNTSVGTKARKKQPSLIEETASAHDRELEQSLLALESAIFWVLDGQFVEDKNDTETLYWQRRLKNIVTPVSLALAEHKGPRRFHYHYRHRAHDETILHPVLEPSPLITLAHVCEEALALSQSQLVGIQDSDITKSRQLLEKSLRHFLERFNNYKADDKK